MSFNKHKGKWRSSININGKQVQLNFETEEEAAREYDRQAIRRDGR